MRPKHYVVVNDLIGGYDVSIYNKPVSQHGEDEHTVAWGLTLENAVMISLALDLIGLDEPLFIQDGDYGYRMVFS